MGQITGWREGREVTLAYGTRRTREGAWMALVTMDDGKQREAGKPCLWRSTAHRRAKKAARGMLNQAIRPLSEKEREACILKLIATISDIPEIRSELYDSYDMERDRRIAA